ncbi:MAG TPA: BlaI/MecI/CopY family transcriptional regulator [Saprospiraceae bacterium]|nr:BlaI/MecI/CopY family transcriptional regulator [Saprospiraceae bacterium]
MKLSKAEEQLMEYIWAKGSAFMKEIIDSYPDPKPAATTIATLLKRIQDKNVLNYEVFGNSRKYYPLIKKSEYFSNQLKDMITNFFDDSPAQFASFFTKETKMTTEQLEELKKIITKQIKKSKK